MIPYINNIMDRGRKETYFKPICDGYAYRPYNESIFSNIVIFTPEANHFPSNHYQMILEKLSKEKKEKNIEVFSNVIRKIYRWLREIKSFFYELNHSFMN